MYAFFSLAPPLSSTSYIRFSSPSFARIRSDLSLASNGLVVGVIETVVLEVVGEVQATVKCSDVTS